MTQNPVWRVSASLRGARAGRISTGAAIAMVVLAVIASSPDHLASAEAASDGATAQARFDPDSLESRVVAEAIGALLLYQDEGQDAFGMITPEAPIYTDDIYPFVLDAATLETVANGAYPDFRGLVPDSLAMADRPARVILADLAQDGGTWVEYIASNPDTGNIQLKRSWLYLYDGYIFGSGHYVSDSEVQHVVEDAVRLYEKRGGAAFDIITPAVQIRTAAPYPFVLDAADLRTVAHGTLPGLVNECCSDAIRETGDRPIGEVLEDLFRDGGTWVEYIFVNPDTYTDQLKRSWLYLYDGYIFGSGYYLPDSRVQSQVEEALHLYALHGKDAFEMITPEAPRRLVAHYPFVVDAATLETVAHGALPGRVGASAAFLEQADRSLDRIMADLVREEGTWVAHISENVGTRTLQMTRTYLSLHDGYIFGSGYTFPDSRIQSMSDKAIYTYRQKGTAAFDAINNGDLNKGELYPFVRNSTSHMVAHGTLPHLLGTLPKAITGLPPDTLSEALNERGRGLWSDVVLTNPDTGTEQVKRAWRTIHDGHYFGSSYTISDASAQSVAEYAVFVYESNKANGAWVDIITPDQPVETDDLYPFVLNQTDWSTVAHGTLPDQVGECCSYEIRDTATRPFEDVLADLEKEGRAWVTFTFLNPGTGTDQQKRTYLLVHDGLIFGSGYYLLDAEVEGIVHSGAIAHRDRGDAALDEINTPPEEPRSRYLFVVDPGTGTVLAQGVDPGLIESSDWQAITGKVPAAELLDELGTERGAWVEYEFVNPETGIKEIKRSWLSIHEGYVFGAGYYASDALG